MLAQAYHRDEVIWWRKTGENPQGEPVFALPEKIACRFERAGKLVARRDGKELMSRAVVYTVETVAEDDVLERGNRAYPVIAVREARGVHGEFLQNEAYLGAEQASSLRKV